MSSTSKIDFSSLKPSELVRKVSHDGLLFFDSAGNFPNSYGEPLSIIAAEPTKVLRGHISQPEALIRHLKLGADSQTDLGFPDGGLAGWVDYEGNYTFGVYDSFWVYAHRQEHWLQEGGRLRTHHHDGLYRTSKWTPMMSKQEYLTSIHKAKDYISAGDIYQVNLSQKFIADLEADGSLYQLYEQLRESSPAPMACYGNLGGRELLCSSPETFLRMSGRVIETRPIKGTSPRYVESEKDNLSAYQLMSSPKENAELVMITDLLRHDLGQICEYGSVKVDELLKVEKLEQVYHMVSTVRGQMRPEVNHVEALCSSLPGGSITGAPKIRAMEVIKELENCQRGLYTGVVGYLGYNGESQFNIIIRSLVRDYDQLHYHVGAGIVADSVPEKEYEETLMKAEGIRQALEK